MTAPVVAGTVGRAGAGAGASRAAAGGKAAGKGPKHAAGGQGGRDARDVVNLGLGFGAGKGKGKKSRPAGRSGAQRLLVAELLVCVVILALSPLAAEEGKTSPRDWMKRGTAICAVFILLGMVASIGPKSGRAAAALGGLIALVLLVDQRQIFGVLTSKLATTGHGTLPDIGPPVEEGTTGIPHGGGPEADPQQSKPAGYGDPQQSKPRYVQAPALESRPR